MAALQRNPPANLARYLWAQLASIPFIFCTAWAFGVWSRLYTAVYAVFTGLILCCVILIVLDCLSGRRYRFRAAMISFLLAGMLAKLALGGVLRPMSGSLTISIGEGFVLAWAGILCLFLAPYARRPDLIFPLGALWMVQAAYRFGWSINFARWQEVNWIFPPAIGCVIFSLLAWRLRVTWATG
jgi:hypothetical protein